MKAAAGYRQMARMARKAYTAGPRCRILSGLNQGAVALVGGVFSSIPWRPTFHQALHPYVGMFGRARDRQWKDQVRLQSKYECTSVGLELANLIFVISLYVPMLDPMYRLCSAVPGCVLVGRP